MDEVERLISVFQALSHAGSPASKLDVLMQLDRVREARVLNFMLRVLADPREPLEVRLQVLRSTRSGRLGVDGRPRVASVCLILLDDASTPELRLRVALALAEFTDVPDVVTALCRVARQPDESLDVRYRPSEPSNGVGAEHQPSRRVRVAFRPGSLRAGGCSG